MISEGDQARACQVVVCESALRPDVLEFCGDVINFGREEAGEYQETERFEESLLLFRQGLRNHGDNIRQTPLSSELVEGAGETYNPILQFNQQTRTDAEKSPC